MVMSYKQGERNVFLIRQWIGSGKEPLPDTAHGILDRSIEAIRAYDACLALCDRIVKTVEYRARITDRASATRCQWREATRRDRARVKRYMRRGWITSRDT